MPRCWLPQANVLPFVTPSLHHRRADPPPTIRSAALAPRFGPEANEQLAATIEDCIAVRGIYLLMDERLDLIGGPGCSGNLDTAEVRQRIEEFAAAHGWSVNRYELRFVFWRTGAMG